MTKSTIGIFDSGIGGISIWKEIVQLLPHQNTIYLADSKNAPYGQKSKQEIIALCKKNTEYLIAQGCSIVVVACNTATTNAIQILRETYNIPFIGIEPAIKPAAIQTKTKSIGILATKGTLNSRLFAETSKKYMEGIHVIEQIGEGLVPLIENGDIRSKKTAILLEKYIRPMLLQNIDCLVLGCSHYPFLIPQIKKITGASIQIIDSGLAVAKQTKAILTQQHLLEKEKAVQHVILSNGKLEPLQEIVHDIDNTQISYGDF
jgi:glutamate racemase